MELAADLYNDLIEFLEDRQDADCKGDPPQYVPNKAMQLLTRLTNNRESAQRVAQSGADSGTSHREMGPRTPYGLALDLAETIIERDDKNNAGMRSLRPGLTDEYTLARALLDVQPYITILKNDLEEAEQNIKANTRDASNCRASLEETREYQRNCFSALREALQFCDSVAAHLATSEEGTSPIGTEAFAVAERIRNLLMRTK